MATRRSPGAASGAGSGLIADPATAGGMPCDATGVVATGRTPPCELDAAVAPAAAGAAVAGPRPCSWSRMFVLCSTFATWVSESCGGTETCTGSVSRLFKPRPRRRRWPDPEAFLSDMSHSRRSVPRCEQSAGAEGGSSDRWRRSGCVPRGTPPAQPDTRFDPRGPRPRPGPLAEAFHAGCGRPAPSAEPKVLDAAEDLQRPAPRSSVTDHTRGDLARSPARRASDSLPRGSLDQREWPPRPWHLGSPHPRQRSHDPGGSTWNHAESQPAPVDGASRRVHVWPAGPGSTTHPPDGAKLARGPVPRGTGPPAAARQRVAVLGASAAMVTSREDRRGRRHGTS